ncbi:2-C-methyl-D-erythritol 4-phosphate cytidylyltransferase [Paucidesulfovibrio longus]|uniref:2-C-methyl-D-erythritol 4-phosphate cytidylyltransferase n=1 Tax=Paucidesulfovibrio longus TaxID=889 RepID=UPI0003B665F0|nr:2-C-methyl-D-erythritol 4-phosphate cytidylyltransferase [Paucidesulfovibrio longus]
MSTSAETWAILLAAGSGTRLASATGGERKQFLSLDGAPLYWRSARTLAAAPRVRGLVFVFPPAELAAREQELAELFQRQPLGLPWRAVPGGERRQDSVRLGLGALPRECGTVLVHDTARPFATAALIRRVLDALDAGAGGVVPGLAVTDTIKLVDEAGGVRETLRRSELRAVQTPQGFARALLCLAHERAEAEGWEVTDDASMIERLAAEGLASPVIVVDGEEGNVKITTPGDLERLRPQRTEEPVTGWGYDVHRYRLHENESPARPMVLGGEPIPNAPEVLAHSDGDVLLHALTDAILGCCAGGDIGDHFPDTDAAHEGRSSAIFVKEAQCLARERGVRIVSADLTIIAQVPRLGPHKERIRANIERLLELEPGRVNVKATTEEKLGFTGAKKGIKAVACVSALRTWKA